MVSIVITTIICITSLIAILLLQRKGLPTINIKHEEVQPPVQCVQIPDFMPKDPEELTPKEQKEQVFRDPASAINAFLEGGVDIGI